MSISPALIERAKSAYRRAYSVDPDTLIHAPGRVNLIGEHTDYNDGFVLPMAINYGTVIAAGDNSAGSSGGSLHSIAADFDDAQDSFALDGSITQKASESWANHIRGIAYAMQQHGLELAGANLAIAGDVPAGAGLSSSASLGVATAMALAHIGGHHMLTPTDFALIAQQSENAFVGTACGIMDQLVSARAENASALMIDCRSLNCAPVPMPDDVAVLIVHSGVERELADSAYNERRQQCEAVAAHFGVKALRDISLEQLLAAQNTLDETVFRRAHHVVTENARVLQAAKALADNDLATMGRLMAQSHISMRDDFAITVPKIDALVALLQEVIGPQGGARMTGGGFGGCVVAMMRKDAQESVKAHIAEHYTAPSGNTPQIFTAMPSAGAHIV